MIGDFDTGVTNLIKEPLVFKWHLYNIHRYTSTLCGKRIDERWKIANGERLIEEICGECRHQERKFNKRSKRGQRYAKSI